MVKSVNVPGSSDGSAGLDRDDIDDGAAGNEEELVVQIHDGDAVIGNDENALAEPRPARLAVDRYEAVFVEERREALPWLVEDLADPRTLTRR